MKAKTTYTMVGFYRASTHIWRALCWSQSLNITTAATVWEASMSAVGAVINSRSWFHANRWTDDTQNESYYLQMGRKTQQHNVSTATHWHAVVVWFEKRFFSPREINFHINSCIWWTQNTTSMTESVQLAHQLKEGWRCSLDALKRLKTF